ncbi:(2Fe-2S)-binding protein [Leekyejoonella antrihumi]|uniref:(2Fe-2S)-binding protein n=1 Tax=Leekyejoonella antrihumi TaxID=1660198 RepID=A0A563DXI8_9MICO|nr:(2Fe-2S)-binding protein [Leekyejoonella antrihumi]TWP34672.1 (2Fe-2S)-binding protein [Leekyejoonella antrihumi]
MNEPTADLNHPQLPRRPLGPPLSEPSCWHDIRVTVNGAPVCAQVESRLLLVDFLRHRLGLTGTHVGCEQGSCGACTILVDGVGVRSCLTLAVQADGSDVRTVESLAESGELNRLQRAFHEEHGMQCGFCTPGILMSMTALEESSEVIDDDAIMEHLGGNLCRCTGYVNIRNAARRACLRERSRPVDEGADRDA